eukprot:scaffold17904_cov61-Phaeocystis_antarctica.AAC.1
MSGCDPGTPEDGRRLAILRLKRSRSVQVERVDGHWELLHSRTRDPHRISRLQACAPASSMCIDGLDWGKVR